MITDPRIEQREKALERAQSVRLAKAETRRHISDLPEPESLRFVAQHLADEKSDRLDAFKIAELLGTIPKVGKSKAAMLAAQAERLEPMKRVRQLSMRQRGVLAQVLLNRADEAEARRVA